MGKGLKRAWIEWFAGKLPPCSEIIRLSSESMDRPLSRRERTQMWLHFKICIWCQRYEKQIHFLRDILHKHPQDTPGPTLSPVARERMRQLLRDTKS